MVNWTPEELERWKADRQLAARRSEAGLPPLPVVATVTPGKRIRQDQKPLLNKLEMEWLTQSKAPFPLYEFQPQAIRFRTSRSSWYKPDFIGFYVGNDPLAPRLICIEVKGPREGKNVDRGILSLKTAATQFKHIQFTLWWKDDGTWKTQVVLP